jgi:hypothetical protein
MRVRGERLSPDRGADRGPLLEQREDVFVRDHGDLRVADGANRVIHFFEKKRLRVRQVP